MPGSGNDNALVITADGDIGLGDTTPDAALDVERSTDRINQRLGRLSGQRRFRVSRVNSGATEMDIDNDGNMTVSGNITASTTGSSIPDYVFEKDYSLMSLSDLEAFIEENKHLPRIPSASDVGAAGGALNMTQMQLRLLEKVEELTLYTLEQQKTIDELKTRLEQVEP
jgi:hypothetical protein